MGLLNLKSNNYKKDLLRLPTPVMKIDKDFTIEFMNEAGASIRGMTPEECIGSSIYQISPHSAELLKGRINKTIETCEERNYEDYHPHTDGNRWYRSNFSSVKDGGGETIAIQIVTIDVTDWKKEEKILKKHFKSQRLNQSLKNLL